MPTNIIAFPRRRKRPFPVSTEQLTLIAVALGVLIVIGMPSAGSVGSAGPDFSIEGP